MLNPVHLQTLRTVLRAGSFADAGRQLGYTPSAVSQQISTLERQLKVALFEREAHSIRPTPAAEFIVAHSDAALGSLRALEDDIQLLLGGVIGRLRVGSFPTASERLLPSALSAFKAANEGIDVGLDEGEPQDLIPLLLARELDVALVYRYSLVPRPWPRGVKTRRLVTEELLLLLPPDHPEAGRDTVDVARLADEIWVSTRNGTAAATMLRQLCRGAGFEPAVSYRSNNYQVIQGLVSAGMGIAVVPALGYEPRSDLAVTRLPSEHCFREVFLATSPTTPTPLADAIADALATASAALARSALGVSTSPGRQRQGNP
jgi:DNA-binding transcriptional LysR family regulator